MKYPNNENSGQKVALVTGASRGLGAAISQALAAAGWIVAINYSKDDIGASHVVHNIVAQGHLAASFQFDILDQEQQCAGLSLIKEKLGPIGLIVNNANGPQPELPLERQSWQDYSDQLNYSLRAPFQLLQLILPEWKARQRGTMVNIGSEAADIGSINAGHYVAAKGAMLAATRSWAKELAKDNITINLVAPGWIPVERHSNWPEERRRQYLEKIPFTRLGKPQDVAQAVVFLASDGAQFITGQRIAVNGGRTMV